MASTDGLRLRRLGPADIEDCLALSDGAGWNQTADDWRFMLDQGLGFGLAEDGAPIVASALVLPFGETLAWISMVLVDPDWRRRGLATRLMEHCLEACAERGYLPFLDATAAGAEVYAKLGFEGLFGITRWQAESPAMVAPAGPPLAPLRGPLPAAVSALDLAAFGADRSALLTMLLGRSDGRAFAGNDGRSGFVLARDGRRAWQIGPLVALDAASAQALLTAALAGNREAPCFVDLCDGRDGLEALLKDAGFTKQRGFLRMRLGKGPAVGVPEMLFAIAGPELG